MMDTLVEDIIESVYAKDELVLIKDNVSLPFYLPRNTIIAGGYVANILLEIYSPESDIDIFIYGNIDYDAKLEELRFLFSSYYKETRNFIESYYKGFKIQVILNQYDSPFDVIKSFDLYPSQVYILDNKIYGTKQAQIAYKHKINIFDVNRANMSYLHRMRKYHLDKGLKPVFINGKPKSSIVNNKMFGRSMYQVEENKILTNIKYAFGLNDNYYAQGGKIYFIPFTYFVKKFKGEFFLLARGEPNKISFMGNNIIEIKKNYDKFCSDALTITRKIEKRDLRFLKLEVDERQFYDVYNPAITPESPEFKDILSSLEKDECLDFCKDLSRDIIRSNIENWFHSITVEFKNK